MSSLINQAVERVNSDTPPFFKRVRKIGQIVAYVGGIVSSGVVAIASAGIAIPAWVIITLTAITAMGGTAAGISSLATSDKKIQAVQYEGKSQVGKG